MTLNILVWYLSLSAIGFVTYAWDKHAAIKYRWRVAETTLHGLDVAGAWPGSWLARRWLRHKIRKRRFVAVFWLTCALNVSMLAAWSMNPVIV